LFAEGKVIRWLAAMIVFESSIGLAGPWLSAHVIDSALPDEAPGMLKIIVGLLMVAALYGAWAGWLRERLMAALVTRVEAECLSLVLGRFLRMDYLLSSRRDFGSTHETMSSVSTTSAALMRALLEATSQVASAVLMMALVAFWFPALAAAVALAALAMLALASVYAFHEATLAKVTLETSSRQRQTLHVLLGAVATLRVLGATGRAGMRWSEQLGDYTQAKVRQEETQVSQDVLLDAFPQLIGLGATAWFVSDVMAGQASLGEMMMGVILISSATGAMVTLAGTVVGLQALRSHFQRVDRLLEQSESRAPRARGRTERFMCDEALTLERVWFRYDESARWVLEDQSYRFPAHQISELRAPSGAGKTTVLRLLAGLFEPERGSVRVLGHNPREVADLVSYLPQQSILLESSIATNLCVLSGRPLEDNLSAARQTGLADLLESLPMGVETVLTLSGGNLSAGQRQLILLTAAFASERPVVLLDEATSQLDPDARQRIDWPALTQDKTVIIVKHD